MALSIRELCRHTNQQGKKLRVRQIKSHEEQGFRINSRRISFSILTYNTALMIPIAYKGEDRDGVVAKLIEKLRSMKPDIVHLCEMFIDDEREEVRKKLKHIYPHYSEGPDGDFHQEDGGNLVLSKTPILAYHESIYDEWYGYDGLSEKGVIHIRIQPNGSPVPIDVFATHMQDLGATKSVNDPFPSNTPKEALYNQLVQAGNFMLNHADPKYTSFIIGDLNIPAGNRLHYTQMLKRLKGFPEHINPNGLPPELRTNVIDLWKVKHPQNPGNTTSSSRLDYILLRLKGKTQFIPICDTMELVKWSYRHGQISDHFGLLARFECLAEIRN